MMTSSLRALRFASLVLAVVAFGRESQADFTVDFKDLSLPSNSAHINGAFQSGGLNFNNSYSGYWSGGFAYSNVNNTTTPGFTNDTAAITGTGRGPGSDIYGVATGYSDATPTTLTQLNRLPTITVAPGTSIAGMYVTNTTYAYLSMLNGDNFGKKFGGTSGNDADFFKLTAYGTNALGQILSTTVDFFLADFRFSNNAQDYIVNDWRFMDLSALSGATQLHFNVSGSDVGRFGLNTPAYFAVDDILVTTAAAVPEPTSLALVALGVAGLGLAARRNRRVA